MSRRQRNRDGSYTARDGRCRIRDATEGLRLLARQPLLHARRLILSEALQEGSRVALHEGDGAVLRAEEAGADGAVEELYQRGPEAVRVEKAEGLGVDAELRPGPD